MDIDVRQCILSVIQYVHINTIDIHIKPYVTTITNKATAGYVAENN